MKILCCVIFWWKPEYINYAFAMLFFFSPSNPLRPFKSRSIGIQNLKGMKRDSRSNDLSHWTYQLITPKRSSTQETKAILAEKWTSRKFYEKSFFCFHIASFVILKLWTWRRRSVYNYFFVVDFMQVATNLYQNVISFEQGLMLGLLFSFPLSLATHEKYFSWWNLWILDKKMKQAKMFLNGTRGCNFKQIFSS